MAIFHTRFSLKLFTNTVLSERLSSELIRAVMSGRVSEVEKNGIAGKHKKMSYTVVYFRLGRGRRKRPRGVSYYYNFNSTLYFLVGKVPYRRTRYRCV